MNKAHLFKFFLGLILIIGGGLGIYFYFNVRAYPVAIVNATGIISADEFEKGYQGVVHYYRAAVQTYDKANGAKDLTEADLQELRRAVLDSLIENKIIAAELEDRVGDELRNLITQKISQVGVDTTKLAPAAEALYGFSFEDFRNLILDPQARREILMEKFIAEKKDFNAWLKEQRLSSSVVILNGFSWKEGRVSD
jgi:hypothetical protein